MLSDGDSVREIADCVIGLLTETKEAVCQCRLILAAFTTKFVMVEVVEW